MHISKIIVESFLGVDHFEVDTSAARVHLFAGINGAGKSSVRDAVVLALTADLGRAGGLKKDAPRLINTGKAGALCEVHSADGDVFSVTITAAGKIVDTKKGRDIDPALVLVLDGQRFAAMPANERRTFLSTLCGVKADATSVRQMLTARGIDNGRIDRVLVLLRAGFPAAHEEAKSKVTAAKAVWRTITGETYGSEKAKTWAAAVPPYDPEQVRHLATAVQHADVALERWQQQIGQHLARQQHTGRLRAKLPGLQELAGRVDRIAEKLAIDEASLKAATEALQQARAAAGVAPRAGLVHDLAQALNSVVVLGNVDRDSVVGLSADRALAAYEAEHGPVVAAERAGDAQARAKLPELVRAHALMLSAVDNDRRDLAGAQRAGAEADATMQELAEAESPAGIEQAQAEVTSIKASRAETVKQLDALKSLKAQAEAAEAKTQQAADAAADAAAWDLLAAALAPDGIPSELLAAALGPMNTRLSQSSDDTEWPQVTITAEMELLAGGREYRLLSESEQWRVDAVVAEAISHISGCGLLVLDRADVLDMQGRADLLAWLDLLATDGDISTALLFMTLKQCPAAASLPASCRAHWIERGRIAGASASPVLKAAA